MKGNLKEEEQVISTNQFAAVYKINPSTAGKGLNILVDQNIIYKKRGIGMFVSSGAKAMIIEKRKGEFYTEYIQNLIFEAKKLGITKEEIIEMIEREK